ncbi:MAG TPA: NAD(P)/FAD-dependent oxidoreductase [Vicinamibacterales bacterium]|nr:NAD(P)/FAD-dependent oxidoreductase [Vicinamibacterales bacterium]
MRDVIVIGGGLNGLVAAAWLSQRRLSTVIVDQRPDIGGATATAEIGEGFRAPMFSHSLGPIDPRVLRALHLDRAGIEFIMPDPALTSLGPDGRTLVFHRDPVLTAAAINQLSPGDASRWRDFLHTTQRIAGVIAALGHQPLPSIDDVRPRDWWPLLGVGRKARALGRRDLARLTRWLPMAVADLAGEWFENDLLLAALCARAVFGSFAGPWSAGTGAMLLQRLAEDPLPVGGGMTARGGPGAVAKALVTKAGQAGAQVLSGIRVTRVIVKDGRATGVELDNGQTIDARAVIAAIDPRRAMLDLVDPAELPVRFRSRMADVRARGVTAKINLALSGLPVFPGLHGDAIPLRGRFLVAPDVDYIERAFDAAKYGQASPAPWLELAVPSVLDRSLAPEERHVMSIYVHFAPRHLRGAEWRTERDALYRTVLGVLEPHAPGLDKLVLGRQILTPEDFERDLGSSGGHIFHGEPTLDQSWIARPLLGWSQYRTPVRGLYLASAGTHPGGGLTGLSGWLAARVVEKEVSS